jgi:NAD(P) transhydrogenase subunit beta
MPIGSSDRINIGVLAERAAGERRVALIPSDIGKLIDMDEINERFVETDVAIVVGANDVVNPAARTNPGSPIFGMPILKVTEAKSVLVLKRGKGKGFSGVENDLFVDPKTSMLFGDARQSLLDLGLRVKEA